MADPIVAGGVRVAHIFQGDSGLSEDRFVTTWAFKKIDASVPSAADQDECMDLIHEFYNVTPPTLAVAHTATVASFHGNQIDGVNSSMRAYSLHTGPPRVPRIRETSETIGAGGVDPYPEEVALVLSFAGGTAFGPRARGRVYLGPLNGNISLATGGGVRPLAEVRDRVASSALRLLTNSILAGFNWGILSQTTGVFWNVVRGWVDDSYDTQRRRGLKPSTRTEFVAPA